MLGDLALVAHGIQVRPSSPALAKVRPARHGWGVPPATESDAGRRRLLWCSTSLNLLLAIALVLMRPAPVHEIPADPAADPETAIAVTSQRTGSNPGTPKLISPVIPSSEPTPWSRLMSADLREYATNLRLAGCPAETVCDILRPEGKRIIEARTEAARFHTNFWLSGAQLVAHRQAVETQASRWQQGQAELLTELGCLVEWPEDEGLQIDLILRVVAGFLPRERQLAGLNLVFDAIHFQDRWRERTQGVVLPADLQWLGEETRRTTGRLRQVLSVAEFEELCLRTAALIEFHAVPDEAAAALALTPAEFRELHRRGFVAGENELERLFNWERVLTDDERPSRSDAQRDADQRAVLGETRAEELRLRSGPTYATTREWAEKFGLDATAPRQVFAELEQFRQAVAALAQTGREQPDAVKADFRAAQAAAQARLEQSLSRVPATNRTGQIQEWLRQTAEDGWRQP